MPYTEGSPKTEGLRDIVMAGVVGAYDTGAGMAIGSRTVNVEPWP